MRLLDSWLLIYEGIAELVEFQDEKSLPKYAILSHTWGAEEVLYDDIALGPNNEITPTASSMRAARRRQASAAPEATNVLRAEPHVKAGWNKILNTCLQACRDGYEYVWIDTCCINKDSSSELSEAINSMWRWYNTADVCYVYLADCVLRSDQSTSVALDRVQILMPMRPEIEQTPESTLLINWLKEKLRPCRWFTRGWTLQELIAPHKVHFFDCMWEFFATKHEITFILGDITGIHLAALLTTNLTHFSIAQRMSWASKRQTTRVEDEAYCLLGIFGVNMPLLYGEGRQAFIRLQEHIANTSVDMTILAWELRPHVESDRLFARGLFAPSPANFWWHASDMIRSPADGKHSLTVLPAKSTQEYGMTSDGMRLLVYLHRWRGKRYFNIDIACLDCYSQEVGWIGLRLVDIPFLSTSDVIYARVAIETVSTREEPEPVDKRLINLGHTLSFIGPKYTVIVPRIQELVLLYDPLGAVATPLLSELGLAMITLQLPPSSTSAETWQVIDARPRMQWYAQDSLMRLPIVGEPVYGTITVESGDRLRCTVLVGIVQLFDSVSTVNFIGRGYCQYWIFPGPLDFDFGWTSLGLDNEGELKALERLCHNASSFGIKDFFEQSTRRIDANKFVLLPNGDILRISLQTPQLSRGLGGKHFDGLGLGLRLQLSLEKGAGRSMLLGQEFADLQVLDKAKQPLSQQLKLVTNLSNVGRRVHWCWQFENSPEGRNLKRKVYLGRPGIDGLVPLSPPARSETIHRGTSFAE